MLKSQCVCVIHCMYAKHTVYQVYAGASIAGLCVNLPILVIQIQLKWPNDGFQTNCLNEWMNVGKIQFFLMYTHKAIITWWKPNQFIIMQIYTHFTYLYAYNFLCHWKKIRHATHNVQRCIVNIPFYVICCVLMKRTSKTNE